MADESSAEGTSSSHGNAESSESTVEVNVKTLDSQIYTFRLNKNMPVSLFKEKIASAVSVPVGQQRLIYRGKVLKDNDLLSQYHLEDGHTLHLVARQPIQSETAPGTSSGENVGNRGNNSAAAAPRNRFGQVSHSMVLETFNIGDQGEGIVPDLSRFIGTVLNSIGVGNMASVGGASNTSTTSVSVASRPSQGVGTDANQVNNDGRSQTGNQVPPGQSFPNILFQSPHQSLQFPFPAVVTVPSLQMVIPDSLTTLSEFINRMELALSHNGYESSPPVNVGDSPMSQVPSSNAQGLPAPDVLVTVMRQAQQLLSGPAGAALSNIAGRIEREGGSTDPVMRGQIQSQAMQVGVAMQHLGALLLELGRTIMMLRMGQSPAESVVNSGPAVYISPSGPNPIMVQPFPLQASSLFGVSSAASQANVGIPGSINAGDAPRNISIHIHAGTGVASGMSSVGSRSSAGEAASVGPPQNQAQASANGTGSVNLGPTPILPVRNVVAAIPGRSPSEAAGHVLSFFYPLNARSRPTNPNPTASGQGSSPEMQPSNTSSVSQPTSQSVSPATVIAQVQMHVRSIDGSRQGENSSSSTYQTTDLLHVGEGPQALPGASEVSTAQSSSTRSCIEVERNQLPDNMEVNGAGQTRVMVGSSLPYNSGAGSEEHQLDIEDTRLSSSMAQTSLLSSMGDSREFHKSSSETAASSSQSQEPPEGEKTVPLGLGPGGLQPKRRSKQMKTLGKDVGTGFATPVSQNQQSIARGQQVLQALVSQGSDGSRTASNSDANGLPVQLPPVFRQIMENIPLEAQGSNRQNDAASMMSHLLQSPALEGLLEGVSEQAGIGSATGLRSIMGQLVQSPSIRNTLNQIAENVGGQDLGNMFLGSGGGQGGVDFSRMFQQLMPVVSQALSQGTTLRAPSHGVESEPPPQSNDHLPSRDDKDDATNSQIDLRQAVERIEDHDSPTNLFHVVVQNASHLYGEGNASEDIVEELCSDTALANEFAEMLQRDIRRRLQSESSSSGDGS